MLASKFANSSNCSHATCKQTFYLGGRHHCRICHSSVCETHCLKNIKINEKENEVVKVLCFACGRKTPKISLESATAMNMAFIVEELESTSLKIDQKNNQTILLELIRSENDILRNLLQELKFISFAKQLQHEDELLETIKHLKVIIRNDEKENNEIKEKLLQMNKQHSIEVERLKKEIQSQHIQINQYQLECERLLTLNMSHTKNRLIKEETIRHIHINNDYMMAECSADYLQMENVYMAKIIELQKAIDHLLNRIQDVQIKYEQHHEMNSFISQLNDQSTDCDPYRKVILSSISKLSKDVIIDKIRKNSFKINNDLVFGKSKENLHFEESESLKGSLIVTSSTKNKQMMSNNGIENQNLNSLSEFNDIEFFNDRYSSSPEMNPDG